MMMWIYVYFRIIYLISCFLELAFVVAMTLTLNLIYTYICNYDG